MLRAQGNMALGPAVVVDTRRCTAHWSELIGYNTDYEWLSRGTIVNRTKYG